MGRKVAWKKRVSMIVFLKKWGEKGIGRIMGKVELHVQDLQDER